MNFEYLMNSDEFHCRMKIRSCNLTAEESLVIENWLMTDATLPERIVEYLKKALEMEDKDVEKWVGGNEFWWKSGKEYTHIMYQYEERFEEGKCPFKPCKVSTKFLYEILEVWAVEYEKWRKEQH